MWKKRDEREKTVEEKGRKREDSRRREMKEREKVVEEKGWKREDSGRRGIKESNLWKKRDEREECWKNRMKERK